MAARGSPDHLDLSVSDPARSIPFYAAFFEALGYRRMAISLPDFQGAAPRRACWSLSQGEGPGFGVEVRPAAGPDRERPVDRYAPGLHHLAFHAESRAAVDAIHEQLAAAGAEVLDAPADYSDDPAYGPGYYAAFFADPDGLKLEVVHWPRTRS